MSLPLHIQVKWQVIILIMIIIMIFCRFFPQITPHPHMQKHTVLLFEMCDALPA